ncbi:hypothetical protein [Pseudooceanicola aestuarii]|uniref:hypothetical protein n=1 Tax=Pseudooceanicola aestuarii TaxID=2697319 RepID=UPI0013D0DD20|nr:hypothetical protein [Pseudooceanicola aestuarii]
MNAQPNETRDSAGRGDGTGSAGGNSGVLAMLEVSQARRVTGLAVLGGLAAVLTLLALAEAPAALPWRMMLLAMAGLTGWAALRMYQATALTLTLTEEALCDSSGHEITRITDIASVDRGFFAFKPSNGFILRLSRPVAARWRPGVYWQARRRVGVGGLTRAAEARAMADVLSVMLARREG